MRTIWGILLVAGGVYIAANIVMSGFGALTQPPFSYFVTAYFFVNVTLSRWVPDSAGAEAPAGGAHVVPSAAALPELGARIAVAPRAAGAAIRDAVAMVLHRSPTYVTIAAWGTITSALANAAIASIDIWAKVPRTASLGDQATAPFVSPVQPVLVIVSSIADVLAPAAVAILCVYEIAKPSDVERLGARQLYGAAFRRLIPFVATGILAGLVLIPLLIVLPAAIYLLVRWSAAFVTVAVEPVGPIAALRRSWDLTRGLWWHAFALVVAAVLVYLIDVIFDAVFDVSIVAVLGEPIKENIAAVVGTAAVDGGIKALSISLMSAVFAVLYCDLRVRKEGRTAEMADGQAPTV